MCYFEFWSTQLHLLSSKNSYLIFRVLFFFFGFGTRNYILMEQQKPSTYSFSCVCFLVFDNLVNISHTRLEHIESPVKYNTLITFAHADVIN